MMIYKPANVKDMEAGVPPTPEHMADMGKLIGELVQSGVLLATDGLHAQFEGRARQAVGRKGCRYRWSFHRNQGADWRLRDLPIAVQSRGH